MSIFLIDSFSHLVGGTLLLFTLQMIGSTFGGSIIPDILLQGMILASIVANIAYLKMGGMMHYEETVQYLVKRASISEVFSGLESSYSILRNTYTSSVMKTLAGLHLAIYSLKIATVILRSGGCFV